MLIGNLTLVLSIEKRINFTLDELAPTSKAYDYFRTFFDLQTDDDTPVPGRRSLQLQWRRCKQLNISS